MNPQLLFDFLQRHLKGVTQSFIFFFPEFVPFERRLDRASADPIFAQIFYQLEPRLLFDLFLFPLISGEQRTKLLLRLVNISLL